MIQLVLNEMVSVSVPLFLKFHVKLLVNYANFIFETKVYNLVVYHALAEIIFLLSQDGTRTDSGWLACDNFFVARLRIDFRIANLVWCRSWNLVLVKEVEIPVVLSISFFENSVSYYGFTFVVWSLLYWLGWLKKCLSLSILFFKINNPIHLIKLQVFTFQWSLSVSIISTLFLRVFLCLLFLDDF